MRAQAKQEAHANFVQSASKRLIPADEDVYCFVLAVSLPELFAERLAQLLLHLSEAPLFPPRRKPHHSVNLRRCRRAELHRDNDRSGRFPDEEIPRPGTMRMLMHACRHRLPCQRYLLCQLCPAPRGGGRGSNLTCQEDPIDRPS